MTTQVSLYQKGKTNVDFTHWVAVASAGPYAICTSRQTENHASTPPLVFYRLHALPDAQPTASKHWDNNNNDRLTAFDPGQPG